MTDPLARRALRCHPLSPCDVVHEVTVELAFERDVLVVAYRIVGELARLRVPTEPLDPERLWAHTCCELFVAPEGGEGYVEHNVSPNGQTRRFDFSAYRQRVSSSAGIAATTTREPDALVVVARVPLTTTVARLAVTTVVEDEHGTLSYWALRHPEGRPDFHHRDGFALCLTLGAAPAIVDAAP